MSKLLHQEHDSLRLTADDTLRKHIECKFERLNQYLTESKA